MSGTPPITPPEFRQLLSMVKQYQEGTPPSFPRGSKFTLESLRALSVRDANYVPEAIGNGEIPYQDIALANQSQPELVPVFETLALLYKRNHKSLAQRHLDSLSGHPPVAEERAEHMRCFHAAGGNDVIARLQRSGLLRPDYQLHPLLTRLAATPLAEVQSMLSGDDLPDLSLERSGGGRDDDPAFSSRRILDQLRGNAADAQRREEEQRRVLELQLMQQEAHRLAFEQYRQRHRGRALSPEFEEQLQAEYFERLAKEQEKSRKRERDFDMER